MIESWVSGNKQMVLVELSEGDIKNLFVKESTRQLSEWPVMKIDKLSIVSIHVYDDIDDPHKITKAYCTFEVL